jgi:CRP-like cAMP-binding protein/tetratricopeptide (TPR) repeat protein
MNLRKLIKELRHKLRRDQDNLALRLELADLYRDDGNVAEALQIYREVATVYTRAGRLDDAKVACRRALDLAPRDVELEALMSEIRRAQRAAGSAVGRDVPQRRAQVWQTANVVIPDQDRAGSPEGSPAADPSGAEADPDLHASRMASPSVIYAGAHSEGHSAQFALTPTPLPTPLPLHDAVEDSLMAQQPMRLRASLTGPVPQVSLPNDLTDGDDDVLALAEAAAAAGPNAAAPEHLPSAASEPDLDADLADGDDPDDDEEDTDVRDRMARLMPIDEDHGSEDLTRPVLRLATEPPLMSRAPVPDDRPVFVSGEISIGDPRGGDRHGDDPRGGDRRGDDHRSDGDGDDDPDGDDGRDGRDTHPSLGGGSVGEEAGDDLTWIKELPDPPELPTPSAITNLMHVAVPRALPEVISEGMPRAMLDRSGVVHTPLSAADLLDETHPVSLMAPGEEDDDVPGTVMDAEAVDEDKILAEVPVVDRPRQRRRSAPRTIMDMAPPVPLAAASLTARKAALSAVFPTFPGHVLEDLAEHAALRSFSDSEYVFREGEPGHACFVIASGTVRMMRRDPVVEGQSMVEVARLARGALFGERALLPDRCRHGVAQAVGSCTIYEIPRRTLRELVAVHHALGPLLEVFYREHLVGMLSETMPFLRTLPRTWRESVRGRFRPVRRASGETILRQGERTGGLYMVVLGSVEITQRPSVRRARLLATLGEGAYFGDMSRLDDEGVVGATVSAAGPVELAMLPAEEYDAVVRERPLLWTELCERGQRRELERSNLLTGETPML